MTKIFITIPWFLPAFRAGGPIQSIANLVREYKDGVQYYIFCSDVDLNGAALENIAVNQWVQHNDYTQIWYASPENISKDLVKQVTIITPDILYIIGLYDWHFNMVPVLFCKARRKIISVRGMLHPGALSQKKWKKKIYLSLFRLLEIPYKTSFHATDIIEKVYIKKHFGNKADVSVAANFPNFIGKLQLPHKTTGKLKLVSIALISPMKNIDWVLKALCSTPALIEYHIYGPVKDTVYWNECLEIIKDLPENITVIKHGEIQPLRIKDALANGHVFILPSKSENFGHAIYEALSAGLPVITSHNTPWNDLKSSSAGINIDVNNINQASEAIAFFSGMNNEELLHWQLAAGDYAEKAVNINTIKDQYHNMFSFDAVSKKSVS